MPRYYFDIHDGEDLVIDLDGIVCETNQISDQAVSVLPDIARESLPDGPNRAFWVKVRAEDGAYVYRASLVLSTAWLDDNLHADEVPGQTRIAAVLERTRNQLQAMLKDHSEDGFLKQLSDIDALLNVAELEAARLLGPGAKG